MENPKLDIRKYDWFEIIRNGLDEDDRNELEAFVTRINEHLAAIAIAGHPFPNYVVMRSYMLKKHKEPKRLRREITGGIEWF